LPAPVNNASRMDGRQCRSGYIRFGFVLFVHASSALTLHPVSAARRAAASYCGAVAASICLSVSISSLARGSLKYCGCGRWAAKGVAGANQRSVTRFPSRTCPTGRNGRDSTYGIKGAQSAATLLGHIGCSTATWLPRTCSPRFIAARNISGLFAQHIAHIFARRATPLPAL